MSEEWKVQFSKKVGQDMWNFRGATVYEVKRMMAEALGEETVVIKSDGTGRPAATPDSISGEFSNPEKGQVDRIPDPMEATDTKVDAPKSALEIAREKAKARMKGAS